MSMLDGTQPGGLTIANHCTMFWNPAGTVKLRVRAETPPAGTCRRIR